MSVSAAVATRSYGIEDIKRMLPHRWPMLMIDRAFEVVPGQRGRGIKAVSVNEPFFAGHFPEHAIMPGVLIVESLAQLVAVIYVAEAAEESNSDPSRWADPSARVGYLGSIRQMKFSRVVIPGDTLALSARLGARLGDLRSVEVAARVEGHLVAAGSLIVTQRAAS